MVQKTLRSALQALPAARAPARLRSRDGARPGDGRLLEGRIRRHLARRRQRGDGLEPAEPVRRLRRQARALSPGLWPIPKAHERDVRAAVCGARAACGRSSRRILDRRARSLPERRERASRLLHGAQRRLGGDRRSGPSQPRRRGDRGTDRAFGRMFADARAAGELPGTPIRAASRACASATIHTLSIRARARIPRAEILPIIDDAVTTICGPEEG